MIWTMLWTTFVTYCWNIHPLRSIFDVIPYHVVLTVTVEYLEHEGVCRP